MQGVKQYAITVEVSPADAFDIDATTFASVDNSGVITSETETPGVWIFPGLIKTENQALVGVASLTEDDFTGDGVLGTFTLKTSGTFSADSVATISVSEISLGPSSTERDVFDVDALGDLMVDVNKYLAGDADLNGRVNTIDALRILQYAVGSWTFTATQLQAADIDGNGRVNTIDALRIKQFVVGTWSP
jgi:hypothetical protein